MRARSRPKLEEGELGLLGIALLSAQILPNGSRFDVNW